MSMTGTQLILIILSLIAMFWGLYTLYFALKKPQSPLEPIETKEITTDIDPAQAIEGEVLPTAQHIGETPVMVNAKDEAHKDGLPILPRHQRPAPQSLTDDTFKAEITPDNPTGAVVLSADNTELAIPTANQTMDKGREAVAVNNPTTTIYQSNAKNLTTQGLQTEKSATDHDDAFSMLASATETITPVVHTFDENQLKKGTFVEDSPILDTHIQAQVQQEQDSPLNNAVQNINISIFPNRQFERISGQDLLNLVDKYGMKFGAMNMFHRYEYKDGTGLLWFSMMMITEEGVMPFDLNKLPTQLIKGLVLFLSLPHPKAVQSFDAMMSVANLISHDLQATVYDETGEPLNKENIHQMRELAVNFVPE